MDDLISRQAALDAFHDWVDKFGNAHEACEMTEYEVIENLPSAQSEIIHCRECKHGKYDIFDRGMWCKLHPSFDVDDDDFCSFAERREE